MRHAWIALSLVALVGCSLLPNANPLPPGTVSCQPDGYTPAPVLFSFAAGPVTSAAAESTAEAMVRRCMAGGPAITGLTTKSTSEQGVRTGPNEGQTVWLVRVDTTGVCSCHYLIEVNQLTGVPTMIGLG